MKSNLLWKLPGLVTAATGVLITLTPHLIAPVCSGSLELKSGMLTHMKCFWTGQAAIVLGAVVIVTGLLMMLANLAATVKSLGVVQAVIGVALVLLPKDFVIGICGASMKACHITAFYLNVWAAVLIVTTIVTLFLPASREICGGYSA